MEALHANGNFQKTLTLFNKRDFSPPSSSPYVFFTKLCVLCFQCFCTSLDVWIIASKNIHLSFLHLSSLSFFSILFLSISFLCTLLVSLLCHFACFIALPCRLILLPCPATSPPCCAHRCLITLLPFIALLHHTISLLHDLVAIMLQVLFGGGGGGGGGAGRGGGGGGGGGRGAAPPRRPHHLLFCHLVASHLTTSTPCTLCWLVLPSSFL